MERKIILATHGNFAAGIQTSLALICGETKECGMSLRLYGTTL